MSKHDVDLLDHGRDCRDQFVHAECDLDRLLALRPRQRGRETNGEIAARHLIGRRVTCHLLQQLEHVVQHVPIGGGQRVEFALEITCSVRQIFELADQHQLVVQRAGHDRLRLRAEECLEHVRDCVRAVLGQIHLALLAEFH